jgi:negative regulator of sigma E activity
MATTSNEELISFYLDGELSPEETVRVEQLLQQHGDLRQLHDELKVIRASLRSLPAHRLEASFSSQVLRQAERTMLREPATDRATEDAVMPAEKFNWPRPFSSVRSVVWAAMAISAALLIGLFLPEKLGNGPQEPILAVNDDKVSGDRAVEKESDDESHRVASHPVMRARGQKVGSAKGSSGFADHRPDTAAREIPDRQIVRDLDRKLIAKVPTAKGGQRARSERFTQDKGPDDLLASRANSIKAQRRANLNPSISELQRGSEVTITATFAVSNEALARGAIETLLARNDIVFDDAEDALESKTSVAGNQLANKKKNAGRVVTKQGPGSDDVALRATAGKRAAGEGIATEPEYQVIYIEATRAQIEATLSALAARERDFKPIASLPEEEADQLAQVELAEAGTPRLAKSTRRSKSRLGAPISKRPKAAEVVPADEPRGAAPSGKDQPFARPAPLADAKKSPPKAEAFKADAAAEKRGPTFKPGVAKPKEADGNQKSSARDGALAKLDPARAPKHVADSPVDAVPAVVSPAATRPAADPAPIAPAAPKRPAAAKGRARWEASKGKERLEQKGQSIVHGKAAPTRKKAKLKADESDEARDKDKLATGMRRIKFVFRVVESPANQPAAANQTDR